MGILDDAPASTTTEDADMAEINLTPREIADLCRRWNHATRPWIHKTDRQHRRDAQVSRAIINRLTRRGAVCWRDYGWTDNDYLSPMLAGKFIHGWL